MPRNSGLEEEAPVTKTSHGHRVLLILHPWIFFISGFIESKVYVRNYESLEELKVSIAVGFRELTPAMVTSTLKNMDKRLRKIIRRKGGHIEK